MLTDLMLVFSQFLMTHLISCDIDLQCRTLLSHIHQQPYGQGSGGAGDRGQWGWLKKAFGCCILLVGDGSGHSNSDDGMICNDHSRI